MTAIETAPPPARAGARRLAWRQAEVVEKVAETRRATTLVLDVPDWPGHRAGQHVDIRLTADDGYQAQRSYSIASPPEALRLALTVERLERGEVSPWLVDEARPGDRFELRGPIGGYFAWSVAAGGPRRAGAPPALLALLRGHHLPRGAGAARVGARRARDRSHAYARAAATRLARSRPADRRVDAGRGRIPARGGAQGIRLRPDDDGGGGGRGAGWARARARARQDRALRSDRRRVR